jgi:predicted negative regulator of RcsB-dependent stress response
LPPWLRPIPYQIPIGGGFEGESVLVFEVVDEQSPSVAAGRLAEYLVETGELDQAVVVAETLRRFPGDVGALVARAQVQAAKQDGNGFAQTLTALQARLSNGADRFLPWDRRVSLAIVLARANQVDAARGQLQRCLAEADGKKLRSLTTGSLYGLEVLTKAFELNISDPTLNALALSLLPRDLRERL